MHGKLRVVHHPQVPCEPFFVPVTTPEEAILIIKTLADYDKFQLENKIKPDCCSTTDLQTFNESEKRWETWCSDDGIDIHSYIRALESNEGPYWSQDDEFEDVWRAELGFGLSAEIEGLNESLKKDFSERVCDFVILMNDEEMHSEQIVDYHDLKGAQDIATNLLRDFVLHEYGIVNFVWAWLRGNE